VKIKKIFDERIFMHRKNVVTIGGGSGQFSLLSGLRDLKEIDVTAVVSMFDSGGSTGKIREEFGALPPGDILKCLIALSPNRDIAQKILLKRINGHKKLTGHNFGNMLLTIFSSYTGNFPDAVDAVSEILEVRGKVLPVTIDKATLAAELIDKNRIYGESTIDIPDSGERKEISEVFLVPHYKSSISAYRPVIEAINNADHIIIGPGDLFTSIIPPLIVSGVKEAIRESKAQIIYVLNIMTKNGETNNYSSVDFVHRVEECLEKDVNAVVYNDSVPPKEILKKYSDHYCDFVRISQSYRRLPNHMLYSSDMLRIEDGKIRHDPLKLGNSVSQIMSRPSASIGNDLNQHGKMTKLQFFGPPNPTH
jgi:uncharacterized cofD-like protein